MTIGAREQTATGRVQPSIRDAAQRPADALRQSRISDGDPGERTVVAEDLGKSFGDREVVKGLSFEVKGGTIFGVIGPSGCGKTTTMRLLLGVLRPTSGDLRVLGRAPHKFRRRERERLGYMPQQFVLFPELSVSENLGFAASIYGMAFFGRGKRIRRALELVELWDARNRPAGQLSGGMQRRLELAATLVHNPEIIFLDEPTAGIDPVLRAKFWDHFRALRDEGRTLIVTTQYVTESEYCDEILVLRDGQKIATGTPEAVRRMAMGGEVVTVAGPDLNSRAVVAIREAPGVKKVSWNGRERLDVIVEEAGPAVPALIDALRAANIEFEEVGEQHPSFDDVFVQLMSDDQGSGESRAQSDR
ncbi:MAG: ABC transporter ATP-binding protein [Chloroflexi bacterium]|nr:ABC transporter ATP-binding protein [Chloroflexota bacterium]